MGIRIDLPPGATPIAAVDAIMAMYGRENVELAIETLIARLDAIDGDPDIEANGDELDGSRGEDDFGLHIEAIRGAGCPIADPGGGNILDERESDGDCDNEPDDPAGRRTHRDYLRRAVCDLTEYRGYQGRIHREYRLKRFRYAGTTIGIDGRPWTWGRL